MCSPVNIALHEGTDPVPKIEVQRENALSAHRRLLRNLARRLDQEDLSQRKAMAKCRDGVALDRRRKPTSTSPFSELHLQLISPSTSPDELSTTLTSHSIIPGEACFAYFNKIWGNPGQC